MILITDHLAALDPCKRRIALPVDRRTLAKRRWRSVAEDGTDFGFDLPHALRNGTAFYETDTAVYVIEQQPEAVLSVSIDDARTGALYGWMIGNMHFPAAFQEGAILAEDDPAVRQMLERNRIPYKETEAIFEPPVLAQAHRH